VNKIIALNVFLFAVEIFTCFHSLRQAVRQLGRQGVGETGTQKKFDLFLIKFNNFAIIFCALAFSPSEEQSLWLSQRNGYQEKRSTLVF
jgi:hypothetical protein